MHRIRNERAAAAASVCAEVRKEQRFFMLCVHSELNAVGVVAADSAAIK